MRSKYPPAGFKHLKKKPPENKKHVKAEISAAQQSRAYLKSRAASLLMSGLSVTDVAKQLDISRETIHRWKATDPLFSATIERQDLAQYVSQEAEKLIADQKSLRDKVRQDVVKLKLMGACVDAVDVILDIMRNASDDKTRLMAAKEVLDRGGFHKTAQIEVHHTQNPAEEVMLAEAFQVLGVDPEMSKYALPADGGVDGQRDYYAGSREYEEVLEPAGEESSTSQAECEQAVGHGGPIEPGSDSENQSG